MLHVPADHVALLGLGVRSFGRKAATGGVVSVGAAVDAAARLDPVDRRALLRLIGVDGGEDAELQAEAALGVLGALAKRPAAV
eukprot:scaffold331963_cov47-Prasinocladus_malaysianus.AAC.1